jgi:multidrug efflux pump subunit AcrB
LIRLLAEHRVAANLAMIMMTLAGLWAVRVIPTQLDPPQHIPVVLVEVQWRGAAAEDVEELVTTPIEQQLRTVNDLKELRAYVTTGYTRIVAEFTFDADMVLALDNVKQRVSNIRNLPTGIEPPVIRRIVDLEPISAVLVSGPGDLNELIPRVRAMEKTLLARGVAGITYDGMPAEEIALLVSGRTQETLGLTLDDIAAQVARQSRNVPAGNIGRGQGSRQLRSLDQARDPLGFEQIMLEHGDTLIRLADVADVVLRPQDGQPIVTHQGNPAIQMTLWRNTDADAYAAHKLFESWLAEARAKSPPGMQIDVYNDVWGLLGAQLKMVLNNGLSGLLLVAATLFAFLSGRVGWWVMVGIPVSFLLALVFFHGIFGYGVSIIALIGFIMALGIVVDDAIVVGEDAVTHFEAGHSPAEAAVAGAQRMFVPVVTSSLTTMAAFLPLLLIGGQMGAAVLALPAALLCIIAASLFECFAVLPGHLRSSFEKMQGKPHRDGFRERFDAAFRRLRDRRFQPLLERALTYPGATLCAAVGAMVCALSLILSQHVGVNFVTGFDIEAVAANVEFAASATDAQKRAFADELEETLAATGAASGSQNLLGWVTRQNLARFSQEDVTGTQYLSIEAPYAYEESRTIEPAEFANRWRAAIKPPPYVEQLTVVVDGGANNGQSDITLVLRGADIESLKAGADELTQILSSYDGVSNVTDDLPYGKDQLIFELTPTGRALGLTSEQLGAQLYAAYSGRRVQIFNQNEAELEVRVMLPDAERDNLSSLNAFPVRTPGGEFVPLANVAHLYTRRGIDTIRHHNGALAVRIFADVDPEVNNAIGIVADVKEHHLNDLLDRYNLSFGLTGKSANDEEILATMALGSILTLVLIYLILAWVFSSYLWPLAIMVAIPFGLTGAVFGHWITGYEIGAMSLLAFFALTGIVVNDSIVLISFMKRDLEAGRPMREALHDAVLARFRAIVLTSLTTIAGLLPLAFVRSSLSFYIAPIAITICFGLGLATLLVMLVLPALVLLLESARGKTRSLYERLVLNRTIEGTRP